MSKIVNTSQQIVAGATAPASSYSRQVLVQLNVPPNVGGTDYGITLPLGNKVWLLSIDLWIYGVAINVWHYGLIHINTGTGQQVNAGIVATQWQPVMDTSMLFNQVIIWQGETGHLHFEMGKLFTTESQRFGVVYQSMVAQRTLILGAFQVSEG